MKRVVGMVAACGLAVCACGDVVIENVCGSGVNVIATENAE